MPMLATATVTAMTTSRTNRPTAGRRIAARRSLLGLSGPDVERLTNGTIYQKLLSRIETGKKLVATMTITEVDALLRALQWTYDEFARETGVSNFAPQPVQGASNRDATRHVPSWGPVSAGVMQYDKGAAVTETASIEADLLGFGPHDLERIGALKAEGPLMLTPAARASTPDGAVLLVEWGAFPLGDDLVLGWLPEHGVAGLKRNNDAGDQPLRATGGEDLQVPLRNAVFEPRGVVRWVTRRP